MTEKKPLIIDGVYYESYREAENATGLNRNTIIAAAKKLEKSGFNELEMVHSVKTIFRYTKVK